MTMSKTTFVLARLLVERCGWRMWKENSAWYSQKGPGEHVYHLNGDPDMTKEALISILDELPPFDKSQFLKESVSCVCESCIEDALGNLEEQPAEAP